MKEKEMSIGRILGYGSGSLGKDFANGVVQSFLLLFYTDVFGIPAAAASVIFLVSKIWDAVNDPMMGAIADRSPVTKWGKYRPYVLIMSVPLSVLCYLCFLSPNFGPAGKVAYAAITYTLMGMAFTGYDVPLWAMVPSLSNSEKTRNRLISVARTFTMLAMFIASGFTDQIVKALGGGSEPANLKVGYPRFMLIIGVVSVLFAIITFLSTKEVNVPQNKPQSANIFKDFKKVVCKPLISVLLSMMLCAMGMIMTVACGTYYMIYYIGNPGMIGIYMMVCMGCGMVGSLLAPALMRKISPKNLTRLGFITDLVVGVIVFFIGHANIMMLLVLFGIVGVMVGMRMVTITTLLTHTVIYIGETKGERADGVCFALNSFANKVGQAITNGGVSLVLAISGYVANAQQSGAAMNGILVTRSLLPAVIGIAGIAAVSFWSVEKKNAA